MRRASDSDIDTDDDPDVMAPSEDIEQSHSPSYCSGAGKRVEIRHPLKDISSGRKTVRIVCISDTHCLTHKVEIPDGDILLCAGDFTMRGRVDEISKFNELLGLLPHKHKLVVEGNHELKKGAFKNMSEILFNGRVLLNESVEVEGVCIYGSRWKQPFDAERNPRVDILLCHAPPPNYEPHLSGFPDRLPTFRESVRKPRPLPPAPVVQVFGHVHCGYGLHFDRRTTFINAANYIDRNRRRPAIFFDFTVRVAQETTVEL